MRERVGVGLEVAGLAVPEDEPDDAGLQPQVGGRAGGRRGRRRAAGSLPANCIPAKNACQVGSTDWGSSRHRRNCSSVSSPFSLNMTGSVAKGGRRHLRPRRGGQAVHAPYDTLRPPAERDNPMRVSLT